MNQSQKDFALNSMHTLHDASKHMMIAHHIASHCESVADYHFDTAMDYIKRLEMLIERYRDESTPDSTAQFRTLHNPHLTTYKEDDRKPHTFCPHCGNEDDYDEELRCPVCGLWSADQSDAKLYRLIELAKNFTDDELDKAFTLIVTEVVE